MLPLLVYEMLPLTYTLSGGLLLLRSNMELLLLGGVLLYIGGALISVLRSMARRRDIVFYPNKIWLQPEWLYELMPFIQIGLVILIWRSPLPLGIKLAAFCLLGWALICLHRRHIHRLGSSRSRRAYQQKHRT